ncbi:hypothetical protein KCP76_21595 [Salmonella enterica subsp. enterica serovar Weltevreden]|nr:hypothetical protein KCP76_21595 [Salmonella enterica subsp. enterica serovar Weltevreden]
MASARFSGREEFCILDIIKNGPANIRRLRSFSVGRRVCGSRRKRYNVSSVPASASLWLSAVEQNGESLGYHPFISLAVSKSQRHLP